MRDRSFVRRGAIGGILAATTVVVFFLLVDLVQGEPLRTPTFLGSVLLGREGVQPGFGLIALYTILHYAVFVALGIAVAGVLERTRAPAALLLGLVIGFLLFDLTFYASVWLTGVDVMQELGWPAFLVGNLLAGLTLIAYLGRSGPSRRVSWSALLREHDLLREGLIAGAVGAIALAAWFFLVDLVLGRILFTPAALGSALFLGVEQAAAVEYSFLTVLGYTVVHVAAFMVVGFSVAAIVEQAEEHPSLLLALMLLFVTFETMVIGLIAIVAAWLLDLLAWWGIAVGNVVAAIAMGLYLWKRHPRLRGELGRAEQSVAPPDGAAGLSRSTPAGP